MLKLKYHVKMKQDLKLCSKRGCKMDLFQKVVEILRIPDKLPDRNKAHNLSGNYAGFKECHISPDWLLIYRYNDDYLELARTGTHSDLFNK